MKKKQKKADRETGEAGTADSDDDGPPQGEGEQDETCSEIVLYDKELAKKAYERYGKSQFYMGFCLKVPACSHIRSHTSESEYGANIVGKILVPADQ
jgi:hypothetical protein